MGLWTDRHQSRRPRRLRPAAASAGADGNEAQRRANVQPLGILMLTGTLVNLQAWRIKAASLATARWTRQSTVWRCTCHTSGKFFKGKSYGC